MRHRDSVESDELNPLMVWGQRFLVVVLLLLAGFTLLTDRFFPSRSHHIRSQVTDILAPLVDAAGFPVRWSNRRIQNLQSYVIVAELASQAEQMATELAFLQQQLDRRDQVIQELRANVNLPPPGLENFLTARVLLIGNSLFAPTLVLNVGRQDVVEVETDNPLSQNLTVRPGLAVVTRNGILGRVTSVGENSSRVQLITNRDSALPVMVGEFRVRGTVLGNGTRILRLITEEALPGAINIGDRVLTSTIDPNIPFFFQVGEVTQVVPQIQILPSAIDSDGIDSFVQVVLKEPLDQLGGL